MGIYNELVLEFIDLNMNPYSLSNGLLIRFILYFKSNMKIYKNGKDALMKLEGIHNELKQLFYC